VIRKATTHVNQNEGLIFERSRPGKTSYSLPPLDVPEKIDIPAALVRGPIDGETEVSEVDVARHFTRLSRMNLGIEDGLYPLGSCTMKHNPRINEEMARLPGFAASHPCAPESVSQGNLALMWRLERILAGLTGLARVTLTPCAGAQGELAGILMIRKALEKKGNPRKYVLIPDSAHGTNPATATFAGYEVGAQVERQRAPRSPRPRGGDDRGRRGADDDRLTLGISSDASADRRDRTPKGLRLRRRREFQRVRRPR
jgi:glycine dehydrogenase subunit 2